MIVKCAICNQTLREKEPLEDRRVSHTYCSDCYAELAREEASMEDRMEANVRRGEG